MNSSQSKRRLLGADTGCWSTSIPAIHQRSVEDRELGSLPVWIDQSGQLRIALRRDRKEHAHDYDQIIVDVAALLRGVGLALDNAPEKAASR